MDQEKARIFMFSLAKIVHNLGAFPPRKIITTNVSTYDYAVVKTWYVRLKLNFYKFFFFFFFLKTGKTEWRQYEDLNGHRRYQYIIYNLFTVTSVDRYCLNDFIFTCSHQLSSFHYQTSSGVADHKAFNQITPVFTVTSVSHKHPFRRFPPFVRPSLAVLSNWTFHWSKSSCDPAINQSCFIPRLFSHIMCSVFRAV